MPPLENEVPEITKIKKTKKSTKRFILIALSSLFALIIMAIIILAFTHPHLESFIKTNIAQKGIESEGTDLSALGYLHMSNVHIPAKTEEEPDILIADLLIRPPLPMFPGSAKLKDITIKRKKTNIYIPSLEAENISIANPISAIHRPVKDILENISAHKIEIPKIDIFSEKDESIHYSTVIQKVRLEDYSPEILKNLTIQSIQTEEILNRSTSETIPLNNNSENRSFPIIMDMEKLNISNIQLGEIKKNLINAESLPKITKIFDELNINSISIQEKKKPAFHKIRVDAVILKDLQVALNAQILKDFTKKIKHLKNDTPEKYKKDLNSIFLYGYDLLRSFDTNISDIELQNPEMSIRFTSWQTKFQKGQELPPEKLILNLGGGFIEFKNIEETSYSALEEANYNPIQFSGNLEASYCPQSQKLDIELLRLDVTDAFTTEIEANFSLGKNPHLYKTMEEALNDFYFCEAKINYTNEGLIKQIEKYLIKYYNFKKTEIDEFRENLIEETLLTPFYDERQKNDLRYFLRGITTDNTDASLTVKAKNKNGFTKDDFMTIITLGIKGILLNFYIYR